jgi:hypothetical protein
MKKIHQKRHTPRNLLLDMMSALYDYKEILKHIEQLLINEPSLDIKDIDLINSKLNINLYDESHKIMNSVIVVFNEYNDHSYWRAFDGEEISLHENTTFGETLFYLEQMMLSNDSKPIISHILNGNLNWLFNHLEYLSHHSHIMSKQVLYDYQRSSFEKIVRSLDNQTDFESSISNQKSIINKLKPLKPIRNINLHDSYLCPKCNQKLFSTFQMHCHNCGQRINELDISKKGDDSYHKI